MDWQGCKELLASTVSSKNLAGYDPGVDGSCVRAWYKSLKRVSRGCYRGSYYGIQYTRTYSRGIWGLLLARRLIVERFDHEGLHQLQNSFAADEDLRGRNVLVLTSLLREVLKYLERKFATAAWTSTTSKKLDWYWAFTQQKWNKSMTVWLWRSSSVTKLCCNWRRP